MEINNRLKDFEDAKTRIEKAIENFFLEYYFVRRKYLDFNFSYRIELISRGNEKYLRFCYGSGRDKICRYIGKLENAIRACVAVRTRLCDNAVLDLVRIIEKTDLPFWFYKTPINPNNQGEFTMDDYINFEFIMGSITKKASAIKKDSRPIPYDLDNFNGFFVEEFPSTSICCKPILIEIDLISNFEFLETLDEKIPLLFPAESKFSFDMEKNLGRYITGRFLQTPYSYFFDVIWAGEYFKVRILNLAGFERNNPKQLKSSILPFCLNGK